MSQVDLMKVGTPMDRSALSKLVNDPSAQANYYCHQLARSALTTFEKAFLKEFF